jgi:hypothetical protein
VSPFTGDGIGAAQGPAVDHDAAADAGAEDHAEHHGGTGTGAIDGFRQGKAVGVVGEAHFALQYGLQVALQRLADQAGGIGILDQAGDARLGARDTHAHRGTGADFLFGALDQSGHGHHGGHVIALRRGDAFAQHDGTIVAEAGDFDFAAAKVDSGSEHGAGERKSRHVNVKKQMTRWQFREKRADQEPPARGAKGGGPSLQPMVKYDVSVSCPSVADEGMGVSAARTEGLLPAGYPNLIAPIFLGDVQRLIR